MIETKELFKLKDKLLVHTRPLKPYNFEDCMQLKTKGYLYFGTSFTERPGEECLVLYPFKSKEAAIKFSKTENETDALVIDIDTNLHELNKSLKDMNIYVQFF